MRNRRSLALGLLLALSLSGAMLVAREKKTKATGRMDDDKRVVHALSRFTFGPRHANVVFVLGGPVKGGRVYGEWPGLNPGQLYEGRDLALTTDFRRVLGEVVARHLGNHDLTTVFPGFDNDSRKFVGLIRT